MFVHDRLKARAVALVMACIAGVQLWPSAVAQEAGADATKPVAEPLGPAVGSVKQSSPWRPAPIASRLQPKLSHAQAKADPVELVLKTARKQLGKPYRWAAVGPNSFDCSGFTMFAWRAAGVELPHNSGAQRAATKHVSLKDMKPGDLIFAPGHVGMYIGKGKMIHSPRSGRVVSIDPIHSNAYGAGRPLP